MKTISCNICITRLEIGEIPQDNGFQKSKIQTLATNDLEKTMET